MLSTPLLEAASISITSRLLPLVISRQLAHVPQGKSVGPLAQLTLLARMRATEVLPVPRGPQNRYAWPSRPCLIADASVRATGSWPTSSAKVAGRYLRYRARYWLIPPFYRIRGVK
ncbi:hypothetical protein D3C72_936370 [compost metagenome]